MQPSQLHPNFPKETPHFKLFPDAMDVRVPNESYIKLNAAFNIFNPGAKRSRIIATSI